MLCSCAFCLAITFQSGCESAIQGDLSPASIEPRLFVTCIAQDRDLPSVTQYMEAVCVHLLLRRPHLAESSLLPVLHSYDARCSDSTLRGPPCDGCVCNFDK